MELLLRGKAENIFRAKDFLSKDGKNFTEGKWQVQFIEQVQGEEGVQLVVHKVSIPEDKIKLYRDKVGQDIEIPVKAYSAKNGVVGFYGV